MKRFFKFFGLLLLIAIIGCMAVVWYISKPLPVGEQGPKAEALADKMLAAVNKSAFDTISYLEWSYPGNHRYRWFRDRDSVEVFFGGNEVRLNMQTMQGTVIRNNHAMSIANKDYQKHLERAWAIFCNDSFWLLAPFKIRDEGTTRALVNTDSGPALLVHHASGGVTPGDSYLWHLDENGRPTAWQLWVSNIPVDGLKLTWENWQQYRGAWIAPEHKGIANTSIDLVLHTDKQ